MAIESDPFRFGREASISVELPRVTYAPAGPTSDELADQFWATKKREKRAKKARKREKRAAAARRHEIVTARAALLDVAGNVAENGMARVDAAVALLDRGYSS